MIHSGQLKRGWLKRQIKKAEREWVLLCKIYLCLASQPKERR